MSAVRNGALLMTMLAAGAGLAEEPPIIPRAELPGIGATDPRHPVDITTAPWRALGRVQTELGTRCTGTLIADRTVLTAAHCLVAPRSMRLMQPGSVHFLLGYSRGSWAAQARVTGYRVDPGFSAAQRGPASTDWALLTLDAAPAPSGRTLPLVRHLPEAGRTVMLGGYQQDRPEVLLADTMCHVLGAAVTAGRTVLLHDCAGTRGVSGAPILVQQPDGSWAVAGLAVAAMRGMTRGLALPAMAVPAE